MWSSWDKILMMLIKTNNDCVEWVQYNDKRNNNNNINNNNEVLLPILFTTSVQVMYLNMFESIQGFFL